MTKFYSVLTNYGVTAFAQAISTKQPLNILKMAVGDGNGRAVTPDSSRTALVREVYRANISSIKLDVRNNKQVIFELTIPEDVGGFYIREMGIFDHNEKLVAIANTPESYKPQLTEGSGKVQVLRMILLVSSSDSVNLTVDNSLIWAKRSELTPKDLDENSQSIIEENGHSHRLPIATPLKKGITQLFSGLDSDDENMAATPKAIKILKGLIDAITRNLGNYIPNSKKSNAVNSNSADTVATSYAVKTAYDLADSAYKVDTNNQNQNLNNLLGQNTVFGTSGRAAGTTGLSDIYNYGVGLAMSAAGARAMLYIPHSHAGSNNGVWVQSNFSTNNAAPHWMRIDGADWADIRNNPITIQHSLATTDLDRVLDVGLYGQSLNANATPERHYPERTAGTLLVTPSAYGVQQEYTTFHNNRKYVRGRRDNNAWSNWTRIDGVDKVDKSGDTMTGPLEINAPDTFVRFKRNGENIGFVGTPNATSENIKLHSYKHGTFFELQAGQAYINKALELAGNMAVKSGDWSKVELFNNANKRLIFEVSPDSISSIGNIAYRNASNSNEATISIPRKNGVMALAEDIQEVAVIKGEISNGGTLPLPRGFNELQCSWLVSMKFDVAHNRVNDSNWNNTRSECYVGEGRVVTARVVMRNGSNTESETGIKYDNSVANYIVIGIK
ncbi:TPA: phage tail protein [Mannheimia haemolytica]